MINMEFIDRNSELEYLEDEWRKDKAFFIPIYGRRRVGKSRLIIEFLKDKDHIYYLAAQESEVEQVKDFKNLIGKKFNDSFLIEAKIDEWKDLFNYLTAHIIDQKRFIIAIDEVTYIIERNASFPSYLQQLWDTVLMNSNVMLIVCGSLVGLMERSILSHSSPLYGRRTGQIRLKPLNYWDIHELISNEGKVIKLYAILGGIPRYYEGIDFHDDFPSIVDSILQPENIFFEEGTFLLAQEFKQLSNYTSALKSIGRGNCELSRIANDIGLESRKLSNYLDKLYQMGFITKVKPVSVSKPRFRGFRYFINDNFLHFWFRFIFPNRSYIEQRNFGYKDIKTELTHFIAKKYESICSQFLSQWYGKVGLWWYKDNEIDIVALNEKTEEILFGECKWSKKKVGADILFNLEQKSKEVKWGGIKRNEKFALFSRSGFTKNLRNIAAKRSDIQLFDLLEIFKVRRGGKVI